MTPSPSRIPPRPSRFDRCKEPRIARSSANHGNPAGRRCRFARLQGLPNTLSWFHGILPRHWFTANGQNRSTSKPGKAGIGRQVNSKCDSIGRHGVPYPLIAGYIQTGNASSSEIQEAAGVSLDAIIMIHAQAPSQMTLERYVQGIGDAWTWSGL